MRIHTIKIRRIREIESLDINCAEKSMIAIVGENGSGKTTIFFSLLFALTGVLTLKGKKEEHVRDIGDGPAWVEVTFDLHGQLLKIRRGMNSTSCTLKSDDLATPIKGSTKVNAWLQEHGLYPDRVLQAFLPQGDADALFKSSDAERAAASLRIFGMSDIECYDEALKAAAEPLKARIDLTLEDRLEEAQTHRGLASAQLEQTQVRKDAATEKRSVLQSAEQLIQQVEARNAADSKRAQIMALLERDEADRAQLSAEAASETELCELRTRQVAETSEAYDRARATIYSAEQYQSDSRVREELQQKLQTAENGSQRLENRLQAARERLDAAGSHREALERLQIVQRQMEATRGVHACIKRQEDAKLRLSSAQHRAADLQRGLAAQETQEQLAADRKFFTDQLALWQHQQQNSKDGRCGTCGQTWVDVPPPEKLAAQIQQANDAVHAVDKIIAERAFLVEELNKATHEAQVAQQTIDAEEAEIRRLVESVGLVDTEDMQKLEADKVAIEARLQETQDATAAVTEAKSNLELGRQNVWHLRKQLDSLQGREISQEDVANAEQVTAAYEEHKQQMQATALRRDMLHKQLADLNSRLASHRAELAELQSLVEGDEFDAELVAQARQITAEREVINAEHDAVTAEHAAAQREFAMFDEQVTKLLARLEQQKVDHKKLDILRGARFILHREQLPRFACSYYTELVSQQWATQLEYFGAKFTAWQDPESLEFFARFPSGKERRVYQLSGGERQLAIVAYLRVINSLFAPDLGILGFDEPTTHVDERARPMIADVFRKMAAQADAEGLQVFVVDHAPEFLSAIPAAIKLQKAG